MAVHPRRLSWRRIAARLVGSAGLLLAAVPCAYVGAAVVGAVIQRNPEWREPSQGLSIFVRSNGVHSDLVLPARAAGHDLYRLAPAHHVSDPTAAGGWIAFGWGQRELYLETPRWADLRLRNAARAVLGGDTLMHVEHLGPPVPGPRSRPIRLAPDAYARLVAAVRRGFATRDARPVPLVGRGYGSNDVFYEATGRYHALRTSNQWTADVLAQAGVRIGTWTPFVQGVMWSLPERGGRE